MKKLLLASLPMLVAAGCARPARPSVMVDADTVRKSTAAQTAASLAPEAFAHAEKIRKDADAAYESGDVSGAQILAERAIAAYQHALVLGRVAYATDTANRASAALRSAEQKLRQSDAEQQRVSAEADDLEVRIKVIKDAAPIVATGGGDASREQARLAAARSLALDARLLCGAVKMIGSSGATLTHAQATLDDADKRLAGPARPAPIDAAMRARAECLAALTAARRSAGATSSIGKSDELLSELSAMGGLAPLRDDRGVVVTLRDVFSAAQLNRESRERIESLGRVAKAHPDFPLQVVVHAAAARSGAPRGDATQDRQRGDSVARALVQGGASSDRVAVEAAGTAHPIMEPAVSRDPSRSDRIEIIFVDPGG